MMRLLGSVIGGATLLISAAAAAPSYADKAAPDHEIASEAVQRGEIKRLADILAVVKQRHPGKVVDVDLRREGERWHYDIRVLDAEGLVYDVGVNAESGAIESVERK
jgi:uncharacterized membrane protein YkoI